MASGSFINPADQWYPGIYDESQSLTTIKADQRYLRIGGTGYLTSLSVLNGLTSASGSITGALDVGSLTIGGLPISNSPSSLTFASGGSYLAQETNKIVLKGSSSQFNDSVLIIQPGGVLSSQSMLRLTNAYGGQQLSFDYIEQPTNPEPKMRMCSYSSPINITSGTSSSSPMLYLGANGGSIGLFRHDPNSLWKVDLAGGMRIEGSAGLTIGFLTPNANTQLAVCDPNMTNGSSKIFRLGHSDTSRNSFSFTYFHSSSGSTSNRLSIQPSGFSDSLVISSGGYVGIGTSNPTAPLHVATVLSSITTTTNIAVNTYVYTIANGGTNQNLGGGPVSVSNVSARFSANVWIQDSIFCTSDRRMKKDIKPIEFDLDHYSKLNPVSYQFINESKTSLGLIAQELLPICSEAVNLVPNERMKVEQEGDIENVMMLVDYNSINIMNVVAIKKLIDEVKDLRSIVDKLVSKPALAKWMK